MTESINRQLSKLSDTVREDYVAVEINGKSPKDQADERGVTPPAVYQNLSRAREKIDFSSVEKAQDEGEPGSDSGEPAVDSHQDDNARIAEMRHQLKKEKKEQLSDAVELAKTLHLENAPGQYTVTERHPEHWWQSIGSRTEVLVGDGDKWVLVDLLGVRSMQHFRDLIKDFDLGEARREETGSSLNLCEYVNSRRPSR